MKILTAADLSQNLPLDEMLRSKKAMELKIKNDPSPMELEAMRQWAGAIFQPIRDHFGVPIYVSSGFRSRKLNTAIVGRVTDSQHQDGEAGDLDQDGAETGVSNRDVFIFIKEYLPFDQLIWEFGSNESPDWVHASYACGRAGRRNIRRAVRDRNGNVSYPLFTGP